MKSKQLVFLVPFSAAIGFFIIAWQKNPSGQGNTPPKVVITKPQNHDRFDWNSTVSYNITVEDKEDGMSMYDEIATNEVFLKIKFLPDSGNAKLYMASEMKRPEPGALTLIKTSDCFNCHAVKSKLLGPSFESVARRYPNTSNSLSKLANIIIKGSGPATGTERMPPHPQLNGKEANEIARWILANGIEPNVDYQRGLQGSFRTKQKPARNANRAVYVLTASYRDHGLPGAPQQQKAGIHVQVLKSN